MATLAAKKTASREGSGQAYIDKLEKQKKIADGIYLKALADLDKAQKDYGKALAWETLLKTYWENIQKTDRLAEDLCTTLSQSVTQASSVQDMADCAVEAFKNMVSDAQKVAKCAEALKAYADTLKNCLSGMSQTDPLYKGLKELYDAIVLAFECIKASLLEMLAVLKDAQTILSQIKPDNGIEETLREILAAFKSTNEKSYYKYDGSWSPCPIPENPAFPLKDHITTGDYYSTLTADLNTVTDCLYDSNNGLRKIMEDALKAANEAKACLDSLNAALAAAKAAIACKTK
jgi:DNA repair exonuclease SbcCD ATPase subunit